MTQKPFRRLAALMAGTIALGASMNAHADTNFVGNSMSGSNTWYATNVYVMTNYTYVLSNSVLTIEPGTVVKGRNGAAPNFGVLFITRGAKIYAQGTAEKPIIFTAEGDDVKNPFDAVSDISAGYTRGQWGGVVILGNALLNNSVNGSTNAPMYDVYEGLPDTTINGEFVHRFGGPDDADNSGVLRYVSIRHGGKVLESAKEINGLSMGGVGNGTTIEYVEAYCIADDGFEFFGGSVNTKHLVSAFNDDDGFDTDQGYHGKNQFWFAIQAPDARDEGSEQNGQPNVPPPTIPGSTPLASYEIFNATLLGSGVGSGSGNDAHNIRIQNFCHWYDSVFAFFDGVRCNIDGSSQPDLQDNLFFACIGGAGTGYGTIYCPAASNPVLDPKLRGVSRTQNNRLDPRPMIGSPVYTGYRTPTNAFYTPVNYKGAFDCDNWLRCWTALDQNLIVGSLYNVGSTTNFVGGSMTGSNTWYATNVYVMTNYTYVLSNSVLTIEPGTVVKGRNGSAPNFGVLYITRGAKIYADGTSCHPIIFTAETDDVNNPFDTISDISIGYTRGQWGGVVILGNALLNNSVNGSTNAPMYDVYEGLPDTTINGEFVHRFGGPDDGDNSGVLRYVSIRHGGKVLESAKEINGLSMGGVGNGTTIEYVEAYCIADDGFEFFGGSVNTKHLVSAFNDDDGFDTDQGYHGKNQFWFAIQAPDARDEGSEQNGQPNVPPPTIPGSTPLASYEIFNATLLGSGVGSGSGNDAHNIRIQNFCHWYDSVFAFFDGVRCNIDGSSQPDLKNNLFFACIGGAGTGYGTTFCPAISNPVLDPQLLGVSRVQLGILDPRPAVGSPVYSDVLAPTNGFFQPVVHKGAFNARNWAQDWSALSGNGIMKSSSTPEAVIAVPIAPTLQIDYVGGGNVNVSWLSQLGFNYTLQSATNLASPISWSTVGGLIPGTGGSVTGAVPTSVTEKYFRVLAQ